MLVNPIYATCSFTDDTVALYIMLLERQFPSSGQLDGYLRLHIFLLGSMMFSSFIILALCAFMICSIFLEHPKLTLTLFLLNDLLNSLSFGKYFLKRLKNSFPIFVETWLLKVGLYQMMLLFMLFCLFVCWFSFVYLILQSCLACFIASM